MASTRMASTDLNWRASTDRIDYGPDGIGYGPYNLAGIDYNSGDSNGIDYDSGDSNGID
jgi:hypothetical protein